MRWRTQLAFAAIAIVVGFAMAFFMLGYPPSVGLLEPAASTVLGAMSQFLGGRIRAAIPEGGPAAFIALFFLTFWPLWTYTLGARGEHDFRAFLQRHHRHL
jgi:hypothetical protein